MKRRRGERYRIVVSVALVMKKLWLVLKLIYMEITAEIDKTVIGIESLSRRNIGHGEEMIVFPQRKSRISHSIIHRNRLSSYRIVLTWIVQFIQSIYYVLKVTRFLFL